MRGVSANQVLGTDMKKHFDITSRFQVRLVGRCKAAQATGACARLHGWLQESFAPSGCGDYVICVMIKSCMLNLAKKSTVTAKIWLHCHC